MKILVCKWQVIMMDEGYWKKPLTTRIAADEGKLISKVLF